MKANKIIDANLLLNANRIACIGTGSPTINDYKLCQLIGYSIAKMKWNISL